MKGKIEELREEQAKKIKSRTFEISEKIEMQVENKIISSRRKSNAWNVNDLDDDVILHIMTFLDIIEKTNLERGF